jgi:ligand-binding sensor domain-containing protein
MAKDIWPRDPLTTEIMKKHIITSMALFITGMTAQAQNSEWLHWTTSNSGIPSNAITALEVNDLGTWVGTENGLARTEGPSWPDFGTMAPLFPGTRIHDLHTAADGSVWVATDNGLAHFIDRQWITFNTENSDIPTDLIRAVTTDADGNVWIGTWGSGLVKFADGEWQVFNADNSAIPSNGIYAVEIDGENRVWVGTFANGAAVFADGQWTVYDQQGFGLPNGHVRSITFGADGSVWLGTDNGLARIYADGEVPVKVYTSLYFGVSVHAFRDGITDIQGGTWFATDAGLLKFEDETFIFYNTSNSEIASNNLCAVTIDRSGRVLAGLAQMGVSIFDADGVALPVYAIPLKEMAMEVFPNPATDGITVKIPLKGDAQYSLLITDLTGRKIYATTVLNGRDGQMMQQKVDVSRLTGGTYLITVVSENDIATAPFVKR